MIIHVGDLVVIAWEHHHGHGSLRGIVYEADHAWCHIMWSDGSRTARFANTLEVVSGA